MKTVLIGFIVMLFVSAPASAVFAQYKSRVDYMWAGDNYYPARSGYYDTGEKDREGAGELESFRGRIVAIDMAANKITVQSQTTDEVLSFTVSQFQLEHLRTEMRVKVLYEPRTNVARRIMNTAQKNGNWWNY